MLLCPWRPDLTDGPVDIKSTHLDWQLEIPRKYKYRYACYPGELNVIRVSVFGSYSPRLASEVKFLAYTCISKALDRGYFNLNPTNTVKRNEAALRGFLPLPKVTSCFMLSRRNFGGKTILVTNFCPPIFLLRPHSRPHFGSVDGTK